MMCFFPVQWVDVFQTMLRWGGGASSKWVDSGDSPNPDKSYIFKANVKIDGGNLRLIHNQSKCNS